MSGTGITVGSNDSISIGQAVATTSSVTFAAVATGSLTSTGGVIGTGGTFSAAVSGATIAGAMVATNAQADAGTASNLIMTPLQVKRQVTGKRTTKYESTFVAMANSSLIPFVHGLGVEPDLISYRLKCIAAEGGYSIGDVIDIHPSADGHGINEGFGATISTTNVDIRISVNGPGQYNQKGSGSHVLFTSASWQIQVKAFVVA